MFMTLNSWIVFITESGSSLSPCDLRWALVLTIILCTYMYVLLRTALYVQCKYLNLKTHDLYFQALFDTDGYIIER